KECLATVASDLIKLSHDKAREDFFSAASVLQDAKLLDADNNWTDSKQKVNELDPDLQQSVLHFKGAEAELKKIAELEKENTFGKVTQSLEKMENLRLTDQVNTEL
ncbi:hypothetical protein JZU71_00060, partial [bacterium]|nr:hypothetical protein [bacterium]